jgi:hypothetical protein
MQYFDMLKSLSYKMLPEGIKVSTVDAKILFILSIDYC